MARSVITSTTNPKVKALAALRTRRGRTRAGRYLVEGERELTTALDSGVRLLEVASCSALATAGETALARRAAEDGAAVIEMDEPPYRKIAYRQNPGGLIGVAAVPDRALASVVPGPAALVLVVEGIEKPGNLGAMLRTADAAGADAVVIADPVADLENPNVIRASQGTVFTVATAVGTIAAVVEWAGRHGLSLIGGSDGAEETYWEAALPDRIGVVVGRESAGLADAWDDALSLVRIPMAGRADSLNTATAAALLLYEVVRRRSSG